VSDLDHFPDLLQQEEHHNGKRALVGHYGDEALAECHGAFSLHGLHRTVQGISVRSSVILRDLHVHHSRLHHVDRVGRHRQRRKVCIIADF
jgi:hypothetical protein